MSELEKTQEPLGGPRGVGMMHVKGLARRFTHIAVIFIFMRITVVILITSGASLRCTHERAMREHTVNVSEELSLRGSLLAQW